MDRKKRRAAIAHHEAGHAVVARILRYRVAHATIVPAGEALGAVKNQWSAVFQRELRADDLSIQTALRAAEVLRAGRAAEERFLGHRRKVAFGVKGSKHDDDVALQIACKAVGHEDEAVALRHLGGELAKSCVKVNWDAISALARRLLERETVRSREINEIIRDSTPNYDEED